MAKLLLIAEKPSVMRDIQRVYSKMKNYEHELVFGSFVGHVVGSAMPSYYDEKYQRWNKEDLPIIPEKTVYLPSPKTKDVFNDLKKKIKDKSLDGVISATDAGREGELIYLAFDDTVGNKLPVYRYWASDSTDESVEKALRNLIEPNDINIKRLGDSSRLRADFDWLIGMNYTRALSLATNKKFSVGRVQTPTLAMIVERDLERKNFVPKDFYEVLANFGGYSGVWVDEDNNRRFDKIEDAKAVVADIENEKTGTVKTVTKRDKIDNAPTLHSLLELQKEAGKVYGYTASKVLDIAQVLYEEKKLITYPRTDSRHLPLAIAKDIKKHLTALVNLPDVGSFAKDILKNEPLIEKTMNMKKYVDDKKVTDHHAILPTNIAASLGGLTPDQMNIYLLIVRRLLAIFMPPEKRSETTIITSVKKHNFFTRGNIIVDKGYKVLYENVGKSKKEVELPNVKEGDTVSLDSIDMLSKKTTPPKAFDDPDLLIAMSNIGNSIEEKDLKDVLKDVAGIGTSATRGAIIENLITKNLVARKGKTLEATDEGILLIKTLGERDIVSPLLTAQWESKLRDVENGDLTYDEFKKDMRKYIATGVSELLDNIKPLASAQSYGSSEAVVVGKCMKCDGDVIDANKLYKCTNNVYKKADSCDFIIWKNVFGTNITKTDVKALLAGKQTKEKKLTFKSGKTANLPLHINDELKVMWVSQFNKK